MDGKIYDFLLSPLEYLFLTKHRKDLFKEVKGRTLEIGFGTGVNFKFFDISIDYTGIDPDLNMSEIAKEKAKSNYRLMEANAEDLPFENESFDTVITTLVLCSVENPQKSLEEIFRVLRPGGHFLLIEHIRHQNFYLSNLQDFLNPTWKKIAGGCNLNRDQDFLISKFNFNIVNENLFLNGIFKLWVLEKKLTSTF